MRMPRVSFPSFRMSVKAVARAMPEMITVAWGATMQL
jgi:hypothetical protein